MTGTARTRSPDSTLALVVPGSDFVSRRCDRYRSDM